MNKEETKVILEELTHVTRFASLGESKTIDFSFLDNIVKLYIPLSHTDLIQKTILKHRTFFENYLLLKIYHEIPENAVIADIGANIGNHTVFFGLCCKAKKVYAFEPLKTAFSILKKNVAINDLNNIEAMNVAVGNNARKLDLIRCTPTNLGGSQFQESSEGNYDVISLDSLELKQLDFIKLDVEGLQSPVLEGAQQTISTFKPNVLMEVLEGEEDVLEVFKKSGYDKIEKLGKTDYLLKVSNKGKWV